MIGPSRAIADAYFEHPAVRKISFTGSTEVGKELIRRSADQVKRLSLELGGHAPLIVFPDADVQQVAQAAVIGKFRNNGQVCIAPSRFYVHEKIARDFTDAAVELTRALKVGNGLEPGVQVGPMFEAKALDKTAELVDDARKKGGKILTGGGRSTRFDKGYWFEPTVVREVNGSMKLMTEEPFAPVMPLLDFSKLDEVIAAANATPYGLAAYVFTNDLTIATRMAEGLEAGIIGINDPVPATPQCPFGGMKESGMGRELGIEGLDAYFETKYVSVGLTTRVSGGGPTQNLWKPTPHGDPRTGRDGDSRRGPGRNTGRSVNSPRPLTPGPSRPLGRGVTETCAHRPATPYTRNRDVAPRCSGSPAHNGNAELTAVRDGRPAAAA